MGVVRIVAVMGKAFPDRIKNIQPPTGSYPKQAAPIFIQIPHRIVTQAVRVVGGVLIMGKAFGFPVKFI